ncbi:MAG: helix-turn-helix transcriptional regulator [Caulobacter sp.]|nr:helix-turn-helix transcriptional regulator [Caulobacter sp.]
MSMVTPNLTELEGAVLTEIGRRGHDTRFKVRRAFETSPSSSWSGSAGAVYPAILRLERAGLIVMQPADSGRRTRRLSLSGSGEAALAAWMLDGATACAIGSDPFRLRAGLWSLTSGSARQEIVQTMRRAIEAELAKLDHRADLDAVERVGNNLAIRLQQLRLAWLDELEGDPITLAD